MAAWRKMWHKIRNGTRGQALIEYVIILAVFAVVVIAAIPSFRDSVGTAYINSENKVVHEEDEPTPPIPTIPGLPDATEYAVIYNANGGTNAPPMQIKQHDVDLMLSVDEPIRSNYVFVGWSRTTSRANAHIIDYHPGDIYTINANLTLYASWMSEDLVYHLRYFTNSPSGANAYFENEESPIVRNKYFDIATAIINNVPICEDYTFLGWNEVSTSSVATYQGDSPFYDNRNADFYAIWTPTVYKVTYHANGGTGTVPDPAEYTPNTVVTVENAILTKQNYRFIGWSTNSDSTTVNHEIGSTFSMPKHDVDLYAVYEPLVYKVIYHANGGTGTVPATASYAVDATVTVQNADMKKTNFKFIGWSTNAGSDTADNPVGSTFEMPARDVDLYAIYVPGIYKVTYHANGGTGSVPGTAEYQAGLEVIVEDALLTKTNYQFASGWSENSGSVLVDYKQGDSFIMPEHDVDLYAVYMPTEFQYNGTNGSDGSIQSFTAPVDGTYQISLWGARGGSSCKDGVVNSNSGYGGFTTVTVTLTRGQTIYFAVGGHGADNNFARSTSAAAANPGGWNGGGNGFTDAAVDEGGNFSSTTREGSGGGGGATAAYSTSRGDGQITNYSGHLGEVFGIAGGSSGANYSGSDGYGGGSTGGNGTLAGTQSTGYAFGKGESATSSRRIR